MMTTMMRATPAKLRDGSWGARVEGRATEGQTVQVEARGGMRWIATVVRVLWTDGRVSLRVTRGVSTPIARIQLWQECDLCGSEPSYAQPNGSVRCAHCGVVR